MCDYSSQAEIRRQALEELIQISEEAGLYDAEVTLDDAQAAIQRVRELHHTVSEEGAPDKCSECLFWYPCDTIKALDGER